MSDFSNANEIPADHTINGETFQQWATRTFEFENCEECGQDEKGHDAAIVMGNWFARCRKPEPKVGDLFVYEGLRRVIEEITSMFHIPSIRFEAKGQNQYVAIRALEWDANFSVWRKIPLTDDLPIERAHVSEYIDLKYKGGYVQCRCGWRKELGDGFNGYHVDQCPSCTPLLKTQRQRKVVTGNPRGRKLTASIGDHVYFVLDGDHGIHVQFSKRVDRTVSGLSESQADKL